MNTPQAVNLPYYLTETYHEELARLRSIIPHPRSLARAQASWRPPVVTLPKVQHQGLRASVTRHRVGPRARAIVHGYGEEELPAYVIAIRMTDPLGARVDTDVAEGWVRALLGNSQVECVHVIGERHAPTFVWLADANYQPLRSPASLFAHASAA